MVTPIALTIFEIAQDIHEKNDWQISPQAALCMAADEVLSSFASIDDAEEDASIMQEGETFLPTPNGYITNSSTVYDAIEHRLVELATAGEG